MKVCYTLICFFFSAALQDGSTGPADTERVYIRTEGGNISVECTTGIYGPTIYFCRNDCKGGDILVKASRNRARNKRYSIEFKKGDEGPQIFYVSITNLTKSDSGRYKCGPYRFGTMNTFVIRVEAAFEPTVTFRPFFGSASTLMTTPSTPAADTDVSLHVRLVLVIVFIVTSAAVLIFFRVRASRLPPEEPEVEPEYMNITEMKRMNEGVREDDRSPPVETSAV